MAVGGLYIAGRIRRMVLPFARIYGQWVEEHIIPMSEQLEKMANAVQEKAYDNLMSQPVGENCAGDGSDEAEAAFDIGLSFYEDITKMYQATLNLFSAGLFHLVEQQLADLTRDAAIQKKVSDTKLDVVVDWYKENCQLDLTQLPAWPIIDELRLVANTAKHAEGSAANQLKKMQPELFVYPALRKDELNIGAFQTPLSLPLGGDGLYVTAEEFRRYHSAFLDLLESVKQYFEVHGDEYFPR